MSNSKSLKRLQSSAESHPIWFLGGALGAGLLLGKLAPRAVSGLLKLGGAAIWKFYLLPALGQKLAAAVEGEDVKIGPLDKETALELVGLQPRPSAAGRLLAGAGLLGAGLVTGASLGLVFAPRTGIELRRELLGRLRDRAEPAAENALHEPVP